MTVETSIPKSKYLQYLTLASNKSVVTIVVCGATATVVVWRPALYLISYEMIVVKV